MLTVVLLDTLIVAIVVITVLHKLPIRFKAAMYKIPTWLLSFIIDALLFMPLGGFMFGAVAIALAEPIVYFTLEADKRLTDRYCARSRARFGRVVEKAEFKRLRREAKAK